MRLIVVLFPVFAALAACSTTPASSMCAYDKRAMLALSEDAFDQDLSNGGGGWRKIGNISGCEFAAAELISVYRGKHPSSSSTLAWHEGQMLASAGTSARAIPLLESAKKDPTKDGAGWNHYVDATIAFLRNDKTELVLARGRLAAVPYPASSDLPALKEGYIEFLGQGGQPAMRVRWPPNIDVVDGFVACFGKPYNEAYGSSCRPSGS